MHTEFWSETCNITTRHHNPEDHDVNFNRRENLRSLVRIIIKTFTVCIKISLLVINVMMTEKIFVKVHLPGKKVTDENRPLSLNQFQLFFVSCMCSSFTNNLLQKQMSKSSSENVSDKMFRHQSLV
jgi:hypothetical protein